MGEYARIILSMERFYSSFSSNAILASTLRSLNGQMIGNPQGDVFVEPRRKNFMEYVREMDGGPEAYAAFIWSKIDFPNEYSYIQVFS